MATKTMRIYIPLLDEGVPVSRPTMGEMLGENVFRVLPIENYDTTTEIWMFPPGTIVRCEKKVWENSEILVASEVYDESGSSGKK